MKTVLIAFALFFAQKASAYPMNNYIEYYSDDACAGPLVGISDQRHACDLLQSPPNKTWSIRINGSCFNIEDTTADRACEMYGSKDLTNALYFFKSDTCTGPISTVVDEQTSCSSLNPKNAVWAIWQNGRCVNIEDTNEVVACERFK